MPRPRPVVPDVDEWTPFPLHGPFRGLNLADNPRSLVDQSPDLLNIDITEDGIIKTDLGYTAEGSTSGTDAIVQLKAVTKSDGTKRLIRTLSTKIQARDGSGWTDIATGLTSGKVWDFVVVNDVVYMVNGTDTPRKWTFDPSVASTTVAGITQGSTVDFFNDRLWTASGSTISYSALGDYENFAGGGSVECYKKDGHGVIVALRHLGRQQIIVKERHKYAWDALTFSTLSFALIGRQATTSLRSIVVGDDGFIYFANRKGIWRSRGGTQDDYLSRDVEPEFRGMDQSKEANLAAEWFEGDYWLGYTPSGATANTMVLRYRVRTGDFLWKDWPAACFTVYEQSDGQQQLCFGTSQASSAVFKRYLKDENASYNHNGAAINAYYVLPYKAPAGRHKRNRWKHLFHQFEPRGSWYVTLAWRTTTIGGFYQKLVNTAETSELWANDGSLWQLGETWTGEDIIEGYLSGFSVSKARGLQFKVAHNVINQPFAFLGVTPHFQPLEGFK